MTEHINKLYKPAELEAAISVLQNNLWRMSLAKDERVAEAQQILKRLHEHGWRLVKVRND